MNHARAAELLFDHRTGRLDPETEGAVAAHVGSCRDCHESLLAFDVLRVGLDAEGAHPTSEEIVSLAMDAGELPPLERRRLAVHCETCPTCRRELDAIRASESRPGGFAEATARDREPWKRLAALAACVAVIAGLLAVFGWLERPGSRDMAGALPLPLLQPTVRDEASPTELSLDRSRPVLPVAVALPAGREVGGVRISLLSAADGETRYELSLGADELRELTRASDVFAILLPTAELRPGDHALEVRGADGSLLSRSRLVLVEAMP